MIWRASVGFSSRNSASFWLTVCSTRPFIPGLPSFVFVCPSNWGSRSLTERTAASPSRTSSPSRFSSFSFRRPLSRAYRLRVPVSAALKPERWEPPAREERRLAEALHERLGRELEVLEDIGVGEEADRRPGGALLRLPVNRHLRGGGPAGELLAVDLAVPAHLGHEPLGQRVHD